MLLNSSSITPFILSLRIAMATRSSSSINYLSPTLRRSARLLSVSSATALIETYEEKSVPKATAQTSRKRKRTVPQDVLPEDQDPHRQIERRRGKQSNPKPKQPKVGGDDEDFVEHSSSSKPTKKRKTREPQPSPIFTIPDVVAKETTFKGRLGESRRIPWPRVTVSWIFF